MVHKKIASGIRKLIKGFGNFMCSRLDSHAQPLTTGFDGCSITGVCPRCGAHVLQDSQGNWFASGKNELVEAALADRAKDLAG